MQQLKHLLSKNYLFFISYCFFLIIGAIVIFSFTKPEGFYFLNSLHTPLLDYIFYFFTFLGDGIFCVAVGVIFFFIKQKKLSLIIIISYLFSGLIVQVIKYFIKTDRPGLYAELKGYTYFIENITLRNNVSFPSGHTTSAFALAAALAFYLQNKKLGVWLLLMAVMVGYSRIYLGQHFLSDVLAGSFIGIISTIACQMVLSGKFNPSTNLNSKKS